MNAEELAHGLPRCLPTGRALSLLGGLALVAAFFMPWFGLSSPQGSLLLSGDFLARFLGSATDLRRFIPGASGDPREAQALRALVLLFPASGALAALLALLGALSPRRRWVLDLPLLLAGLVPLLGLLLAQASLPPGSSREAGLWLIGFGAAAVVLGTGLHASLARRSS